MQRKSGICNKKKKKNIAYKRKWRKIEDKSSLRGDNPVKYKQDSKIRDGKSKC